MQRKLEMNEPVSLPELQKHLYILVCWQSKALEQYDSNRFTSISFFLEDLKIPVLYMHALKPS